MSKKESISTVEYLAVLRCKVKDAGGDVAAAKAWGIHINNLRAAVKGNRLPGKTLLKQIKLKPVKRILYRYERID